MKVVETHPVCGSPICDAMEILGKWKIDYQYSTYCNFPFLAVLHDIIQVHSE